MPPYSRIEERPSEMTNVAISISSDVSFLAFLFSPFSPFLRTRERSKKRERNDREIGRGIHRSGWSKIRGRAWNSDVYRVRGGGGGRGSSISISIHERFIRVETTDAEHRRVSARRNITINLAELITGHAFN